MTTDVAIESPTILPPSLDISLAEHFRNAAALHVQGKLLEASEEIKVALKIKPDSPEAHFNLANIVRDAGETALAVQGFQAAIEFAKAKKHVYPDALINLADAQRRLGHYDDALASIAEAIKLQPKRPEAHIGYALILQAQGKTSASIERLEKAVKMAPDNIAAAFQLGLALHWASRWEDALAAYDQVLKLSPDLLQARMERARSLFRLGRLEEGFAEYESRLAATHLQQFKPKESKPGWDGKAKLKDKTLLVYSEPGFIDEIQFARFIPTLKKQGATIVAMVQEPLRQLFQSVPGVESVHALGGGVVPPHDLAVSLMSLPHLLKITAETLPVDMPYFKADIAAATNWAKNLPLTKGKKIGVAWIGALEGAAMQSKPMTPETLAPLVSVPNVTLISLQQRQLNEQVPGLISPGLLMDFASAAALISNLDLVIAVDSAVAHLAAAMGKPVWLLLPVVPDAPWSLEGDTHPWYPTMRVYRQTRKNNWDEVIKRVAKDLKAF